MKELKIWLTGLALLAWSGSAMAQNEVDALRYSNLSFGGTARVLGLAGAQTALGADASSMSGNPAGLGLYRKSEFTISPGLNFNETESQLNGFSDKDKSNKFIIPQFGFVFTDRKPDEVVSKWRSGSLGIGFTRLNNFNVRTTYESGVAHNNSLLQSLQDEIDNGQVTLQSLAAELNSNGGSQFTSIPGLAYSTYLIDTITVNGKVQLYVPARAGAISQSETIVSRGAQNEWDLSYGGSYQDKLFVGGSIGLLSVRYEQTRSYSEAAGAQEPVFSNLLLTDYFKTTGSGINFKIGLIYKPVDALRIGATVVTPTFYSLTDNYYTLLQTSYKPGFFESRTPDGLFNYNLTTPFRANGGLAYFFGKFGFISGDIEYVDYSNASLSSEDGLSSFRNENNRIAASYNGAINFRIGAEARFDIFRIRGGFGHYGDPYQGSNFDRSRKYFTGGIGLRENNYFVDAAYVHSTWDSLYSPYVLNSNTQPVVTTKNRNASFTVTAGFNF